MKKKGLSIALAGIVSLSAVFSCGVSVGADTGSNYDGLITSNIDKNTVFDYDRNQITTDITTDNTTEMKKILVIEDGANIPDCSFTFTATAGSPQPATTSTLAVIAGVHPENITYKTVADNSDHLNFVTTGGSTNITNTPTATESSCNITFAANTVTLPADNTVSTSTLSNNSDNVVLSDGDDDTYYAEKKVELDFSNCGFTEPGVYRYIITESNTENSANTGISLDSTGTTRTIDVYVEDASYYTDNTFGTFRKNLVISGYVMYVGTASAGPSNSMTSATGTAYNAEDKTTTITPNEKEVTGATKSVGFKNVYETEDLTLSKTVTGNQGSRDKYFEYTINFTEAGAGSVFDVSYSDDGNSHTIDGSADATITAKPNTATTIAALNGDTNYTQPSKLYMTIDGTNPVSNSNAGVTTKSFKLYLQHGQKVVIRGLAKGTKYTITEGVEDYTASAQITGDTDAAADASIATNGLVSDATSGITADTTVAYSNKREGTIPTGVILSVAAPAGIGVAVVGGIIYLIAKRRKDENEDDE